MANEPSPNSQRAIAGDSTISTARSFYDDDMSRASTPSRNNESRHEHEHEKNIDIDDEKETGITDVSASHDNLSFPDGGWRAWLVVLGVRFLLFPFLLRPCRSCIPPFTGDVQYIFDVRTTATCRCLFAPNTARSRAGRRLKLYFEWRRLHNLHLILHNRR